MWDCWSQSWEFLWQAERSLAQMTYPGLTSTSNILIGTYIPHSESHISIWRQGDKAEVQDLVRLYSTSAKKWIKTKLRMSWSQDYSLTLMLELDKTVSHALNIKVCNPVHVLIASFLMSDMVFQCHTWYRLHTYLQIHAAHASLLGMLTY